MAAGNWVDWNTGDLVTAAAFQDMQDSIVFIYADETAANAALTNKVQGTIFYDTTADVLKAWDGSAWISAETGDIEGVTAGTNLTGGGTSGTVTVNLATGGAGAGTYGSTANGTKIDTITIDAYGRVTSVATGATGTSSTSGTVTSVATGTGLTGGTITSTGTISLSHLGFQNLTDPNDDRIAFWDDSAGAFAWLDIGNGLSISGTTISNSITNNNQLTNGAGFITGLDWTELGGDQADINISGLIMMRDSHQM